MTYNNLATSVPIRNRRPVGYGINDILHSLGGLMGGASVTAIYLTLLVTMVRPAIQKDNDKGFATAVVVFLAIFTSGFSWMAGECFGYAAQLGLSDLMDSHRARDRFFAPSQGVQNGQAPANEISLDLTDVVTETNENGNELSHSNNSSLELV